MSVGHFFSKFLEEAKKELFEQDSAVDGFEATHEITDIGAAGHVVDVETASCQLSQVLHQSSFPTACLTHQQRIFAKLEADG